MFLIFTYRGESKNIETVASERFVSFKVICDREPITMLTRHRPMPRGLRQESVRVAERIGLHVAFGHPRWTGGWAIDCLINKLLIS